MLEFEDPASHYTIEVSAARDEAREGYVARVVVRRLPAMQIVFAGQFAASGRHWKRREAVVAAAFARGRQFVQGELSKNRGDPR